MALEEPDAVDASAATVAPQEIQVAFEHAAPVSNRVLLTMAASGGRLSFLEIGPDGIPQFRAAVFLGFGELVGLQQLIVNMLNIQNTVAAVETQSDVSKV